MSDMAILRQLRHILVTDGIARFEKRNNYEEATSSDFRCVTASGGSLVSAGCYEHWRGGGNPITGWAAFLFSSTAFWPRTDSVFGRWYESVLATASVVTTVLFIFGSPWAVLRDSRSIRRMSAWVAATAFIFNAHWYILLRRDGWVSGLGIGYFLWCSSFVLLAMACSTLQDGTMLLS